MTYVLAALGVLLGAFAMAFGEADDSPGLGGIGLIVLVVSVVVAARRVRRDRQPSA